MSVTAETDTCPCLKIIAEIALSKQEQEPTKQNHILVRAINTEEALIDPVNYAHNWWSLRVPIFTANLKEETAVEKTNYNNFRKANFDSRTSHCQWWCRTGFWDSQEQNPCILCKILPQKYITIYNPSWINNDVKQTIARRQRAYDARKRNNTEETNA